MYLLYHLILIVFFHTFKYILAHTTARLRALFPCFFSFSKVWKDSKFFEIRIGNKKLNVSVTSFKQKITDPNSKSYQERILMIILHFLVFHQKFLVFISIRNELRGTLGSILYVFYTFTILFNLLFPSPFFSQAGLHNICWGWDFLLQIFWNFSDTMSLNLTTPSTASNLLFGLR